jgi:NAD(P)-dependent dehydrogenase (short-subunit alcohol dehydrogenase family)
VLCQIDTNGRNLVERLRGAGSEHDGMKHEFLGKAALVVGGTTGIGASVVNDFAANGCDVAFAGLEREEGTALEQRINAGNLGRALFVQTDVRDEAAVEELVAKASQRFGRIHCGLTIA